jgi:hypothetical protein
VGCDDDVALVEEAGGVFPAERDGKGLPWTGSWRKRESERESEREKEREGEGVS